MVEHEIVTEKVQGLLNIQSKRDCLSNNLARYR